MATIFTWINDNVWVLYVVGLLCLLSLWRQRSLARKTPGKAHLTPRLTLLAFNGTAFMALALLSYLFARAGFEVFTVLSYLALALVATLSLVAVLTLGPPPRPQLREDG